jgi:pimeloyl-ACP methyl ester carboxylesterase
MTSPTPEPFRLLNRPDWLPGSQWPFQTFAVETDQAVLAVTEAGRGPALLLVHAGTWSFIWRDLVTRLMADFRCIFFDAPGNGQSRNFANGATLEGASRAVAAVIDALGLEDFTLVAHDLGGPAALAALASTQARVRGLVAMNTFGWRPSGAALRGMLAVVGSRAMREIDVLTGFIPALTATSFGIGRHLGDAGRAVFRAGMRTAGRRAFHDYLRDAREGGGVYAKAAAALAGPLARLPVLTIFGERNDPFGFQTSWKKRYPDAQQMVVKNGNHFPMCDEPELVARIIREWFEERIEGPRQYSIGRGKEKTA